MSWERCSWAGSEPNVGRDPADRLAYGLSLTLNPLTAESLVALWFWAHGDVLGSVLVLLTTGAILAIVASYIRTREVDVFLERIEDRLPPIAVGCVCNGLGALAARLLGSPLASKILTAYALAGLIVYLITRHWKISLHAASMGAVAGLLCWAGDWAPLLAWLPVTGAVCWARLRMNAHTTGQVTLGALGGAAFLYGFLALLAR
ncbi:MAG: hypothetical protein ABGY09_02385 [Euryarchaeota archaeon]